MKLTNGIYIRDDQIRSIMVTNESEFYVDVRIVFIDGTFVERKTIIKDIFKKEFNRLVKKNK